MTDLYLDARDRARVYRGKFPFMVAMRKLAVSDPSWIPTYRQAIKILACTGSVREQRPTVSAGEQHVTKLPRAGRAAMLRAAGLKAA